LRSDFVAKMERRYVNPPILRTNAIVKNKYFRQCLALWDFIERYDDAGYGLVVEENALDVQNDYAEVLGKAAAMQYMMFMRNVSSDYLEDIVGSYVSPKLTPRLETRFARNDQEDFYRGRGRKRRRNGRTMICCLRCKLPLPPTKSLTTSTTTLSTKQSRFAE